MTDKTSINMTNECDIDKTDYNEYSEKKLYDINKSYRKTILLRTDQEKNSSNDYIN